MAVNMKGKPRPGAEEEQIPSQGTLGQCNRELLHKIKLHANGYMMN